MRKLHITFSDTNMTKAAILCRDSAIKHGAHHSIMFNEQFEPKKGTKNVKSTSKSKR